MSKYPVSSQNGAELDQSIQDVKIENQTEESVEQEEPLYQIVDQVKDENKQSVYTSYQDNLNFKKYPVQGILS